MGAPQSRLFESSTLLRELGWKVEVLTALPNYPSGKIYDGYDRRKPVVEMVESIRTVRVPLTPAKSGFVKRLRCYFTLMAGAKRYGPQLCERPDLLWVESPPLFIGYAARYLSRKWNCPFVLNVSDLWPESAIRMGVVKRGPATWLAERMERSLYQEASGVTGQSSEIIDWIRRIAPETPTQVITNGVDPDRFGKPNRSDEARSILGKEPGPIFVYAGLLGLAQGLQQLLDLAKMLPPDIPGRFVLIGDGPERDELIARVKQERITRVKVADSQSRDRIPGILAAADCAVVPLKTHLPGAVPSKIYEAMAAELPILLIAEGEPVRRVEQAECGLCVLPDRPEELHHAFRQLASDPGLRARLGAAGRRAAETTYN